MSADKYDFLKEKIDFSIIPDIDLYSLKKPATDEDTLRRNLEETLKCYEDDIELYTTEV